MNKSWLRVKRALILLAMGASTFGLFGTSFGLDAFDGGCNYALYNDYETMYRAMGGAVIQGVSDGVFGDIGTDFDTIVRTPTTAFAQGVWNNWVAARVPDDVELH